MLLKRGIYLRNSVKGEGTSCGKQYLNGHAKTLENLKSVKSLQKSGKTDVVSVFFLSEIHVAVAVSDPFFVIVCVLPVNRGYCGHLPFTLDAVWFCKSLRWRLQKPFCKSCGYSRLKIVKYFFFKTLQVSNCNKRVQKNSRMFGCLVSFIFIYSVRTA